MNQAQWAAFIRQNAPRYGVDPRAALAVASAEGLSGGVGDQGTSFGPFQLHVGGALPSGRGRAWAESPAGILYALQQIGQVAGGMTGRRAVSNIVNRFERPAAPGAEIERAMGSYGKGGVGGSLGAAITSMAMGGTPGRPGSKAVWQPGRLKNVTTRVFDPGALAQGIFAALAGGGTPDVGSLVGGSYKNVTTQVQVPRRLLKAAQKGTPGRPGQLNQPVAVTQIGPGGLRSRGLAEAFYDPLGSWDNNAFGGAIGHHSDHVHLSIVNPATMIAAIKRAQAMGLHVGENPYLDHVDPVHVPGSFHYKSFAQPYQGKKLGEAIDVSGSPASMAAYYRWATGRR